MTAPRFLRCRCSHTKADHEQEGFAPQCTAAGCTCLSYRPADIAATTPGTSPRPQSIRPLTSVQVAPREPDPIDEGPATIEDWLRLGKASKIYRTRQFAEKIIAQIADIRGRVIDEQRAVEAKQVQEAARQQVKVRMAKLQKELVDLRKFMRGEKPSPASDPQPANTGVHPCSREGCERSFDTSQARALHERRAHDGFNPQRTATQ